MATEAEVQIQTGGDNGEGNVKASRFARGFNEEETQYFKGAREPATSSVLISSSEFLNNPLYRDVFAQFALQRRGHDLPPTYLVPAMVKALTEVGNFKEYLGLIAEEKKKNAEFAAWLDRRRICRYEPAELARHAPGTFGEAVRKFVVESGMDMEFANKGEAATEFDYFKQQQSFSHDLEHLATGFAPNQFGEVALGICNCVINANYFSPKLAAHVTRGPMFLSVTSYSRVSHNYPAALPGYFEAMRQGIAAGQKLKKPLFMIYWEDYLDWKLEDVAVDLGLDRGPGAAWDYSTEATTG
jgi:ubiquinone biosynthesis protein COQ4